mgnify:CR=1 FL=1
MKVLLIVPTFKYAQNYPEFLSLSDFPTGLAYIAAALKQAGHEVYGCNPNNIIGFVNAKAMITDVLTKMIKEVQPELIGLGGLCTDYPFFKDAIEIIRGVDPKICIVLGGQIVTNDADDVFNLLKPDYAVVGDGEEAIVNLINRIQQPGIATNDGSAGWKGDVTELLTNTISSKIDNIDTIPQPDYEPFGITDMMDNYSMATRLLYRYSRTYPRPFGIVTARGCPFSCTFCIDHHRTYRERSIENIMEEIKITYEKYHYNILLILDELFAVNQKRMREFCEAVIKGREQYGWDFDWTFQTHASAKLDFETLKLAKQAGCYLFSYGLESASPTVLESMNKKIKPEQVIEAMGLAEEAKIGFSANLIFGDVAETQETIAESLSFWLTYAKKSFIFLSNVSPYPGSALFKSCQEKGIFTDKKAFYENIEKVTANATAIGDGAYKSFLSLFHFLESSWLFTKSVPITKKERLNEYSQLLTSQGGFYYLMTANCPYCGEEIQYRDRLLSTNEPFFIGTGCTKCGRKIKLEG